MANNNSGEPSSAPQADRWYDLKLGSSFGDQSPSKFCTLRYEFKPASIDKSQPGSLHKNKENRVAVEFNNNQPGKPKVSFEGSSEDYKDNDAVLFFDGVSFRLERLHRAVKRLRHVRLHGESATAAASMGSAPSVAPPNVASAASAAANMESRSPQLGKMSKTQPLNKTVVPSVHVEVERIDIGEPESPGIKPTNRSMDYSLGPQNTFSQSPDPKIDEPVENIDIDVDDNVDEVQTKMATGGQPAAPYLGFDSNIPTYNDADDEIADVDLSDDEAGKGPNAAEALRAQVNAEEVQQQQGDDEESSSSSDSSGSSSGSESGSASGSGSSSSDSSDDDSASSGGEIDI